MFAATIPLRVRPLRDSTVRWRWHQTSSTPLSPRQSPQHRTRALQRAATATRSLPEMKWKLCHEGAPKRAPCRRTDDGEQTDNGSDCRQQKRYSAICAQHGQKCHAYHNQFERGQRRDGRPTRHRRRYSRPMHDAPKRSGNSAGNNQYCKANTQCTRLAHATGFWLMN